MAFYNCSSTLIRKSKERLTDSLHQSLSKGRRSVQTSRASLVLRLLSPRATSAHRRRELDELRHSIYRGTAPRNCGVCSLINSGSLREADLDTRRI